MRIALAQFSPVLGDLESNLLAISHSAESAKAKAAQLLCLPEMCTTGLCYDKINDLKSNSAIGLQEISELAKCHKIAICGSFLYFKNTDRPTNTFLYFDAHGEILGRYDKIHLFKPMGEDLHFEAGQAITKIKDGNTQIGCAICYDLRFPELFRKCALAGAVLQLVPAAFPHPRLSHWRTLLQSRAMENQIFMIATNQCGYATLASQTTHFCGHSMVVHPSGEILYEAGEAPEFSCIDINLDDIEIVRKKMDCLRERRPELY